MVAIASYYASVGVGIDRNSLKSVQSYLDNIQKKMQNFQKNIIKTSDLSLRINNISVNQTNLRRSIRTALEGQNYKLNSVSVGRFSISAAKLRGSIREALGTGTGGAIRLNEFSVNQKALVSAINKALNKEGKSSRIRIGALLSQSSLTDMRQQIRQAINQLVVNPTINPRISQARVREARRVVSGESRGGGYLRDRLKTRDPRSMNPWYNPMMIGGATGAFLRYGMFSLPFVAGAYGLNTLSQNMTRLEGQNIMLTTSAQGAGPAAEQYQKVNEIGQRLGLRTSDMLPFYAQMFAGARGTSLEQTLPSNFQNFMDYAMAMGVNDQQLEGGIRAISQAIAKGAIYSEEWRQQLAEQGFPEAMNILADVAAGGDRDKLRKMMEQGEVDVYKYLPLVLDEMGRRAQAGIGKYFESVLYQQRRVGRANEDFLRAFMDAGAAEGMLQIYKAFAQTVEDSIPMAETLGDMFRRAGYLISAGLVLPRELYDWLSGKERDGNFMTALFGPSGESAFVESVQNVFKQVENLIAASMEASRKSIKGVRDEFSFLEDFIAPLLEDISKLLELGAAYQRGGIGALVEKNMQIENRGLARKQAEEEAAKLYSRTGKKVSRAEIRARADEIYSELESRRLEKPEERSWWQRWQFLGTVDKEMGGIEDPATMAGRWIGDQIKSWFASPEVSQTPVQRWPDTRLGQTDPRFISPMSVWESSLLDRYGWVGGTSPQNYLENPLDPYNFNHIQDLLTAVQSRTSPQSSVVEIRVSGNITVDGEVNVDSLVLNDSDWFSQALESHFNSQIPLTPKTSW